MFVVCKLPCCPGYQERKVATSPKVWELMGSTRSIVAFRLHLESLTCLLCCFFTLRSPQTKLELFMYDAFFHPSRLSIYPHCQQPLRRNSRPPNLLKRLPSSSFCSIFGLNPAFSQLQSSWPHFFFLALTSFFRLDRSVLSN